MSANFCISCIVLETFLHAILCPNVILPRFFEKSAKYSLAQSLRTGLMAQPRALKLAVADSPADTFDRPFTRSLEHKRTATIRA